MTDPAAAAASAGPVRILYVDDDRINVMLFEHLCAAVGGLRVESVGTGAEALERITDWQPQLLVIDLHLPDIDGPALLPRLRAALAAYGAPQAPAVLYTAEPTEVASPRASTAGFEHCWTKPAQMDKLTHLRDELSHP